MSLEQEPHQGIRHVHTMSRVRVPCLERLRKPLVYAGNRMNSEKTRKVLSKRKMIRDLYELISALDRRVPRVERSGESAIARDARPLRAEAAKRIADLERDNRGREPAAPQS